MAFNGRNIPGYNEPMQGESLLQYIERVEGDVSERAVGRIAEYITRGQDAKNSDSISSYKYMGRTDKLTGEQLKSLPVTTKAKLYEVMANSSVGARIDAQVMAENEAKLKAHKGKPYSFRAELETPPFLGALNAVQENMGLTEAFYEKQAKSVNAFLGADNKVALEQKWVASGMANRFGGQNFETVYNELSSQQCSLLSKDAQAVLEFVVHAKNDFDGIPRTDLSFEVEGANSCGWQYRDIDGTSHVNVNPGADLYQAQGGFAEAFAVLMHEDKHTHQHILAEQYKSGQLSKDDPNYTAGAVFHANLKSKRGYLRSSGAMGHAAYEGQVAEVDANYVMNRTKDLMAQNYDGSNPVSHGYDHNGERFTLISFSSMFAYEARFDVSAFTVFDTGDKLKIDSKPVLELA